MTGEQLSLLDLSAARTARDDGIASVEANTHQEWKTLALMIAVVVAVFAFSYWQEYWG